MVDCVRLSSQQNDGQEGSMALLTTTTKEVAPAQLMPA